MAMARVAPGSMELVLLDPPFDSNLFDKALAAAASSRVRVACSCATSAASVSAMATQVAPREAASKPSTPVPANASIQRQPVRSWPSQLNSVSRTRSGVGRRPGRSGTLSRVRFHWPPMMRISCAGLPCGCRGRASAALPLGAVGFFMAPL